MYNIGNLTKIDKQIQSEINAVLDKWKPILMEQIIKEMRKGHELTTGMGSGYIKNRKGEYVAEGFTSHVIGYQYRDNFDTGIVIDNIQK